MSAALRYSLLVITFAMLICAAVVLRLGASAAAEAPHVEFNADNIGPREIENLTSQDAQGIGPALVNMAVLPVIARMGDEQTSVRQRSGSGAVVNQIVAMRDQNWRRQAGP